MAGIFIIRAIKPIPVSAIQAIKANNRVDERETESILFSEPNTHRVARGDNIDVASRHNKRVNVVAGVVNRNLLSVDGILSVNVTSKSNPMPTPRPDDNVLPENLLNELKSLKANNRVNLSYENAIAYFMSKTDSPAGCFVYEPVDRQLFLFRRKTPLFYGMLQGAMVYSSYRLPGLDLMLPAGIVYEVNRNFSPKPVATF